MNAQLSLVDTHVHLDDELFGGDEDEVMSRAAAAGVDCIINIGYRPACWESTIELSRRYPALRFALGLHPNHAGEDAKPLWLELRRLIQTARPIAIGEIGLDYFHDHASKANQLRVFEKQLELADEVNLPVVIHQRQAEADLRGFLRDWRGSRSWILHSFEGSADFADQAIQAGCYFGVGGLMTRANSSALRDVIRTIPLDRIVLETDSPYLTPKGVKSRRNEPANVRIVACALAEMHQVSIEHISLVTSDNANRAFASNSPRDT